jgi:hypothetical protein
MASTISNGIKDGSVRPPIMVNESMFTNSVFMDSRNSVVKTNETNFICNLGAPIVRAQGFKATRVVIPKIYNVTINNNVVAIKHNDGGVDFTIPPGIYSSTLFVNTFTSLANTALAGIGSLDTFTVTYSDLTRKVTIVSNTGLSFFFVDTCSFVVNGKTFAPFLSFPVVNGVGIVGSNTQISGPALFLYSRYFTIHSNAICQNEFSGSRTTEKNTKSKIVCIVDITGIYESGDFSTAVSFTKNVGVIDVADSSSYIDIAGHQSAFPSLVDIECLDEYGKQLSDAFLLSRSDTSPQIGVSLFGNFYF